MANPLNEATLTEKDIIDYIHATNKQVKNYVQQEINDETVREVVQLRKDVEQLQRCMVKLTSLLGIVK